MDLLRGIGERRATLRGGSEEALDPSKARNKKVLLDYLKKMELTLKDLKKPELMKIIQDLTKRNNQFAKDEKDFFEVVNGKNVYYKYPTPEWKKKKDKQLKIFQDQLASISLAIHDELERRAFDEEIARG